MNISKRIRVWVGELAEGTTFRYRELPISPSEFAAAAKTMERLVAKGTVRRLSKGLFYKPKRSAFGRLAPNEEELLRRIYFEGGKRVAYETGTGLYNRLGLTTQVPAGVKVARFGGGGGWGGAGWGGAGAGWGGALVSGVGSRSASLKVSFAKSYVKVSDDNYYLLGLLDALKDFKRIPDMDYDRGVRILARKLKALSGRQSREIVKYALAYPPRVRALLGALLEWGEMEDGVGEDLKRLKGSLNPFSSYSFGLSEEQLPTIGEWAIK